MDVQILKKIRDKQRLWIFLLFSFLLIHFSYGQSVSLAGPWKFKLDSANQGIPEKWYNSNLPDEIKLPGSCQQNGFGFVNTNKDKDRLTPLIKYEGKAWYQKTIEIAEAWRGKRLELFLERCHLESTVWLDGKNLGTQNSLSTAHIYNLGIVSPGKHKLTICIDNTYKLPIGRWGFAITEDTQGNWNGIIGRIEIRATDPVWIRRVQVYRDSLKLEIGNITGRDQRISITGKSFLVPVKGTVLRLAFDKEKKIWDEFSPKKDTLTLRLQSDRYRDTLRVYFGIRDLKTGNGQFILNGRPILVRGPVNEAIYPLTGYPPMDKKSWSRLLNICKSYGFNFMRFNSWCPPNAAFEAADDLGFLLQIELPFWSMDAPQYGEDSARDHFLKDELKRILAEYGNHPSFAFLAMGNESPGPMDELVRMGRTIDRRILFRCADGDTITHGDYAERGTEIGQRGTLGPRTDWDRWSFLNEPDVKRYSQSPMPTMAHEVGQWGSYPDYGQIKKFTGILKPHNYERFRQSLTDHQMIDLQKQFTKASGALAINIYKDEIEGCMRTYPYGGFQIVEARDFPGEGTALIGWLDAFWDSKGFIEPETFKQFCDTTVCLLRMSKRIFTNEDIFEASMVVAHYGSSNLHSTTHWKISDEDGKLIVSDSIPVKDIHSGALTELGEIKTGFSQIKKPTACTVTIQSAGKSNSWRIWVFPVLKPVLHPRVFVAHAFDDSAKAALSRGENVLLFSAPDKGLYKINADFGLCFGWIKDWDSTRIQFPPVRAGQNSIPGSFMPAFWSMRLFNQTGTLGLLCNPRHPALVKFPTDSNSDWQWADILGGYTAEQSYIISTDTNHRWSDIYYRSKAIVLNETPAGFRPIVQVIDNYERNYKLGLIFETRVGKGKLLVCAADLETDGNNRPAAKQLKESLMEYAESNLFNPAYELSGEFLTRILVN